MKAVGVLGTVAIALALATPASAATWTVDQHGVNACDTTSRSCTTITDAASKVSANDTVLIRPGVYSEDPTFSDDSVTVSGAGTGPVFILGTVGFTANGKLQRVDVQPQTNAAALAVTAQPTVPVTVDVESSILSGQGSGAGISATSALLAQAAVNAHHVTVADASAPAVSLTEPLGAAATANLFDSIVVGTKPASGVTETNDQPSPDPAALFVGGGIFLRVGSPAFDTGGGQRSGETTEDVEGESRTGTWDRGADEFVNHPPGTPGLGVSATDATAGRAIALGAFVAPDPDAARGDAVVAYRFDFGDGQTTDSAAPGVTHTYAAAGKYTATVRTIDRLGAVSAPSNAVTVTVSNGLPGGGSPPADDTTAPKLSITSPRSGQRLKRRRRARFCAAARRTTRE